LANDVLSLGAEMLGGSQLVSVIGIDDREAGLGCRSQVDGIGGAQEHTPRQFLINLSNAREDFSVMGKPAERSRLDMAWTWPSKAAYAAGRMAPSQSLRWKAAIISAWPNAPGRMWSSIALFGQCGCLPSVSSEAKM
jgi:hypothetical protein